MVQDPSSGDVADSLDVVLTRVAVETRAPGVQAALVRDGDLLWSGVHGLADTATARPVTQETVFCLASLGKTLVAALTLSLLEQGRLELDEPIHAVVEEVPGSRDVTPRMLLTHTAGYPDIYESPELVRLMPPDGDAPGTGSAYDPDRPFTWDMVLPAFREPVDPGSHWEYSNGGYVLLTELVVRLLGGPDAFADAWASLAARAAGERLADDVLTMDRSRVRLDRLSHGYDEQPDGTLADAYAAHPASGVPTDLFGLPFGDGLFAGTAVGVARFLDGLFVRRTVLDPSTLDLMTATTAQAAAAMQAVHDPALASYGMGTFQVESGGGTWQGHRGRYGGFTVIGMSEPTRASTLVVLSNATAEEAPVVPIWRALAEQLG